VYVGNNGEMKGVGAGNKKIPSKCGGHKTFIGWHSPHQNDVLMLTDCQFSLNY
jgi:hypothetical protein